MENEVIRKKDLIQFYQKKRLFLYLDEWGFYIFLVAMHCLGISSIIIGPVLIYGSIALYTSYKNLDKIERKIIPIEQDIYAYQDLYSLYRVLQGYYNLQIQIKNVEAKDFVTPVGNHIESTPVIQSVYTQIPTVPEAVINESKETISN